MEKWKTLMFHDVKRSDYITNSVRVHGTVIFLNKMKGNRDGLNQLRNWHSRPFFMAKIVYYRVEHKTSQFL